ncbi:MAG: cysteine desulfurase-like protein [Vicinamibacterales bacterium]
MTTAPVLGTDEIRRHFPALARVHNGYPVAYFDGPGGTQVPTMVVEAMCDYLLHHNANTHWSYPTSVETDAILADARGTLADFLNCEAREVSFGANMTTITFHVARAIGRGLQAGDEVVITELDHHANVAPWQALAKERGITLRMVPMVPETSQLDWSAFERIVNPRTRVVAVGAASNMLGTISDVKRVARLAHSVGALCYVDAVHFAAHHLIDVRELECDFLACSAYKFYGPHIGVLYTAHDLAARLDVPKLEPAPDSAPDRLETGTQNHEGIAGAAAAVSFLASLAEGGTRRERLVRAMRTLAERGDGLVARLWNGLRAMDGVTVYGPAPSQPRTSTIVFTVGQQPSIDVTRALAERGLFTSHGDFYASSIARRLGLEEQGLVRVGCACYTTEEEVERVLEGVAAFLR